MKSPSSLDIIIPVFNEEEVIDNLFMRLETCFSVEAKERYNIGNVLFIFVDDGSTDKTAAKIAAEISTGSSSILLRLSRNFGHQNALVAGFDRSKADIVSVIDADLQDPPELILPMVEKLRAGYDVVYGERVRRAGNPFKNFLYWFFYRFLAILSDVHVPVDAGDFCVMKREVLLAMKALPEKLRFPRGLRCWVGFRQVAFPYDRPKRLAGETKYTFAKLYQLATHGVASLSIRPLRITQATLFFSLLVTFLFLVITISKYHSYAEHNPAALWFLLTYILVVFTSSLQIFCLCIIGAHIGRMYLEVKGRPPYIIMEMVGRESNEDREL